MSDLSQDEKNARIAADYQKVDHIKHILLRSDTYIGSTVTNEETMFVSEGDKIVKKKVTYNSGLERIFEEILLNAFDQTVRKNTHTTQIKVNIDQEKNTISVYNNGNGIPIIYKEEQDCYIPEMVFGMLMTSSNYNDEKKRITGGMNGLGAKCVSSNTIIPLFNGSIKRADNISVRDQLIGDDGNARNVLAVMSGYGSLYKVYQDCGEPYIVNSDHILTLHMPEHKVIKWDGNAWTIKWWDSINKFVNTKTVKVSNESINNDSKDFDDNYIKLEEFARTLDDNNIIDISIQDYMKLDVYTKKSLQGIRAKCINWKSVEVDVDPYELGKWFNNVLNDINIKPSAKLNKYILTHNLNMDIHLPKECVINDKDFRLKLLSGIIDLTYHSNEHYSIKIPKSDIFNRLCKELVYMIRSLGLHCARYFHNDSYKIYIPVNSITITDGIIQLTENISTGSIIVTDAGSGKFVGIKIDGNERFAINDFTITHNCTNIFSTYFKVETVDADNKKYFEMEWWDSMSKKSEAVIKSSTLKPYTKVTFKPDLKIFGFTHLTDDVVSIMKKRVIDTAFNTANNVSVFFNDEEIMIKNPVDYINLYPVNSDLYVIDETNERWKVMICLSDSGFEQVSFVNGINTAYGGTHVNHVVSLVSKEIIEKMKTKKIELKPADVKNRLFVFIRSFIENPRFDSQSKNCLQTTKAQFGSEYIMDEKFKKKLLSSSIINTLVEFSKFKSTKVLEKSNGTKTARIFNIDNLEDANWAGKAKSSQCKLIVTEGLSAKTFAMSAISVIGRDKFGIFPLKGKMLNVRDVNPKKVSENAEICNLVKILGLKYNEKYDSVKSLRYGGIISLVDSDSVSGDTPIIVKDAYNNIIVLTIEYLTTNYQFTTNEKEYAYSSYSVWTESGWTPIRYVIRHKVRKQMYRIFTSCGSIDVTEDHSLLTEFGQKISPKHCHIGMKLLHSFPIVSDLNTQFINTSIDTYNITTDEAYLFGLFAHSGSCHNCIWKIGHYDIKVLMKAKYLIRIYYNINLIVTQRVFKQEARILPKWYTLEISKDNESSDIEAFVKRFKDLIYYGSDIKFIHPFIINSSYEIRKMFFDGFTVGYNSKHKYNDSIQITLFDKITAQSLYLLIKSIGYYPEIKHNKFNYDAIDLIVNTQHSKKSIDVAIIQDVMELKSNYDDYVYDLETHNHHFHAGVGDLIVHNTDGIHIHGLLINFFHYFWPELLQLNYVQLCITPIVKVSRGPKVIEFYNLNEYKNWCETTPNSKRWDVKYYKGLGTSNAKEAKQALTNIDKKLLTFCTDDTTTDSVELGFNKKLTDERKQWLSERYDQNLNMDRTGNQVQVTDFINKELIHFSYYDNQRSIPNVLDGFKPAQRKIMYTALKYLTNGELKVAQFGAKVAEKTDYHHGEASIMETIIKMAQNYMGSNNINLLEPNGGFGTRLNNKDAASPRYIHTSLSPIAKLIFNVEDNALLKNNISDNNVVEPEWYIPCVPMILINGTEGIGTGFSTEVLKYNVVDIAEYIISKLDNKPYYKLLVPWFRGFKGQVLRISDFKYVTFGTFELKQSERIVRITELPVGVWTDTYKKMLEEKWQKSDSGIVDIINNSDDVKIDFSIKLTPAYYEAIITGGITKVRLDFHLISKLSETNMHLFDREHNIRKFNTVTEILDYYYDVRLEYYQKRKDNIIRRLQEEMKELSNKMRFIKFVRESKITILKVANEAIIKELVANKFDKIPETDEQFKYLIDMPIRQLTNEYYNKLNAQCNSKAKELEDYSNLSISDMWKLELKKIIDENKVVNAALSNI